MRSLESENNTVRPLYEGVIRVYCAGLGFAACSGDMLLIHFPEFAVCPLGGHIVTIITTYDN